MYAVEGAAGLDVVHERAGHIDAFEFEYGTRVEVAGIEPASFSLSPGILRAQPVKFVSRRLATGAGRRP